jgi:hypothetical protein
MGTVRVSEVKFLSTHLKTLSASPAGGTPAAVGPRLRLGRPLVEDVACSSHSPLVALAPHLHIIDTYLSDTLVYKKNDIYKNNIKITYI